MKTRRILIPVVGIVAAAVLAVAGGWFALGNVADAQTDLTAPANVRAVQGPGIGQAVVSWDAVDGATGYTVRWVDLDAAWAAYEADGRWGHLIESQPVPASGEARHSLNIPNLKTNTTRGHAFAVRTERDGAVSGWSDWQIIRLTAEVDAEAAVEVLAAALAISKHANALVGEPLPTSQADFPIYRATINANISALDQQVQALSGKGHAARVQQIATLVNRLKANTALILRDRPDLLRAVAEESRLREALTQANRNTLFPVAAASVDNQFYHMMTNVGDSTALSDEDILRYSHMDSLGANVTLGHTLLLVASLMQDPTFVARIQESYDGVNSRIDRDIEYLSDHGGPNLGSQVLPLARQFVAAGSGDNNYFDRLASRLELVVQENERIATNEKILDQLLNEIDRLAAAAQGMSDPGPLPAEDPVSPGFTDTEVKFGQSAALTGPSAALGQGMMKGIDAAFKEANAAGGVHGRMLKLEPLDDQYETDPAFDNTRKLIEEEQVFALIGAVGTPTSRAALPLAEEAEVPFIAPFTGAQLLRGDELSQVLNLRASYHQETKRMVDYLVGSGITDVAVLYQNDSYGVDGLMGVDQALDVHGLEPVESWYYRRNTTSVKSAVFRISEADPGAVIIIGASEPAAQAIKMLREKLGSDTIFMNVSFVGSDALTARLTALGESRDNVFFTQVVPLPSDESDPLVARYQAALAAVDSQAQPGFVSLEGYLAGRLAIEGLRRCGEELTRMCFLDAVQNAGTFNLDGFELMFGPMDNQGSDAVFLAQIGPDGNYQVVE